MSRRRTDGTAPPIRSPSAVTAGCLKVRMATERDVKALAELGRALNVHQRDPIEHFTAESIRRDGFGTDRRFETMIAEVDQTPVGYALFVDGYETAYAASGFYMCDLYVMPASRRSGVGRALVAAVAREARRRDRSFVWWASKMWNVEAQDFYAAIGAIAEPVVAHAVFGDALESLIRELDDADEGSS